MSETPQVTQSKLNIAHNEVREVSPTELEPHPKNREIYGDTDDADELEDEFVESIEKKGVLEPLTVTPDGEIISGHRRWLAAQKAELATVPARKESFSSDLEEREALIEFNRQREKTPGQIVNEFEEMLAVERERAKSRQGERTDLEEPSGNVSKKSSEEPARDKAAEKVNAGVSGRTLEKGKKVKDKARDESEPEEVREAAKEAWDGLQSGEESFNSAHKKVKDTEKKVESEKNKNKISDATPTQTVEVSPGDVWKLGEHRLYCGDTTTEEFKEMLPETNTAFAFCDPPYGADAAEWDENLVWEHDYLIDYCETIAVTPGIESIPEFMHRTNMPYRWSVSAWIDNGMTRGALGFGNWIYIALFSNAESLHSYSQDMARVSVKQDSNRPDHKGRKPIELLEWLLERFVIDETDVVIDPFTGSGTTLLTTEQMTDATVYTGEVNPEYCSKVISAWQSLTGKDAEVM